MGLDNPSEGNNTLVSIDTLSKAVADLRSISGLSTLRNDPRTTPSNGQPGDHPLTQFFRLDALAPSADPSRPQAAIPDINRDNLIKFREQAVKNAQLPNATWDQQMTAVVTEYYLTRERLPAGLNNRNAIEMGANMHVTRILTNIYGASEFLNTFDLYVQHLKDRPASQVHRNAEVERKLLEDARVLTVLMPFWGRVVQLHFLEIQNNNTPAHKARIVAARQQLQAARTAIPANAGVTLPPQVEDMSSQALLESVTPVEARLRDIIFTQSSPIESPRHTQSTIEALASRLTGEAEQKELRAALAAINLSEPETKQIQGRRVHAAYINLLVLDRRSEADQIIKKAAGGQISSADIERMFNGHHAVSRKIIAEHRFGLQTTTAHMFAGTLGVSTVLQQNPNNRVRELPQAEIGVFQNFLNLMGQAPADPELRKPLQEQRKMSVQAVRNYTQYMRQEALTLRISMQMIDRVYIEPAIRDIAEGIRIISDFIEGKIAYGANMAIWMPVLFYHFPELRGFPFETDPAGARKRMVELKAEAEGALKNVQSLRQTIDKARKELEQSQKDQEIHLSFIETMTDADMENPAKIKEAQVHVKAIADIDQRIATSIESAWSAVEGNMQYHAKTTAIIAEAQGSILRMGLYIAAGIGSVFTHLAWNWFASGRAVTRFGGVLRGWPNFIVRTGLSVTAGPAYLIPDMIARTGIGLNSLRSPAVTPPQIAQLQALYEELDAIRARRGADGLIRRQDAPRYNQLLAQRQVLGAELAEALGGTNAAGRMRAAQTLLGDDVMRLLTPNQLKQLSAAIEEAHAIGANTTGPLTNAELAAKNKVLSDKLVKTNILTKNQARSLLDGVCGDAARSRVARPPGVINPLEDAPIRINRVTSNLTPEWEAMLKGIEGQPARVLPTLEMVLKDGKITLNPRTVNLIRQSASAQRMFAAATTVAEMENVMKLARQAGQMRAVMHGVGMGMDVLGIYMAWKDFEANGSRLDQARETGNAELQRIYRDARVVNMAEMGASGMAFICGGIAIYASVTGSTAVVCSAAAFLSGTVLLPLGVGYAMTRPLLGSIERASEVMSMTSRDWLRRPTNEMLSELQRLSRGQLTIGEMHAIGNDYEHFWRRHGGMPVILGGQTGEAREKEYQQWWKQTQATFEGAHGMVRGEICMAYIVRTTNLPKAEGETDKAFEDRLKAHHQAQMFYLGGISHGKYDVYQENFFRMAKVYADMCVQSADLRKENKKDEIDVDFGNGPVRFDLATLHTLPFRSSMPGVPSQERVLAAFSRRDLSFQLMELSQLSQTNRADEMRPYGRMQEQLRAMFMRDLCNQFDRIEMMIDQFDFDGLDLPGGPYTETLSKNIVRNGIARDIKSALATIEREMAVKGTYTQEEYRDALATLLGLMPTGGNPGMQELCYRYVGGTQKEARDKVLTQANTFPWQWQRGPIQVLNPQYFFESANFPIIETASGDFIRSISIEEVPALPTLPPVISLPGQAESSMSMGKTLENRRQTLLMRRATLESIQKEMAGAAGGDLGWTPRFPNRAQMMIGQFLELPPNQFNGVPLEMRKRRFVGLLQSACRDFQRSVDWHREEVENYLAQRASSPEHAGMVMTRDIATAITPQLTDISVFTRFPEAEQVSAYAGHTPFVYGRDMTVDDLPAYEATLSTAMEFLRNRQGADQFRESVIRSVTFARVPGENGKMKYLMTLVVNMQEGRNPSGYQTYYQVASEQDGSVVNVGVPLMGALSTAAQRKSFPHPQINVTRSISEAAAKTPVTSPPQVYGEGDLFTRITGVTAANMSYPGERSYQETREMFGSGIAVLIGCDAGDLRDLTQALAAQVSFPSDCTGIQVRRVSVQPNQFLVTYAASNGVARQCGVTLEPNGICRMGSFAEVAVPSELGTVLDARRTQRDSIYPIWFQGERREVARDANGTVTYGLRFENNLVLYRFLPPTTPGEPPKLQFQSIPVNIGGGGQAGAKQQAAGGPSLADTVQDALRNGTTAQAWRNVEQSVKGYRESVQKGTVINQQFNQIESITLSADARLLQHIIALPRAGVGPQGAAEQPADIVRRTASMLGVNAKPEDIAHITNLYTAIATDQSGGAELAHRFLQAAVMRLTVGNQRPDLGTDSIMEQIQQVAQHTQILNLPRRPTPMPGMGGNPGPGMVPGTGGVPGAIPKPQVK